MNTQTLLFERSSDMPEGLYIELMNKLKLDFEKKEETTEVKSVAVVINRSIAKYVQMKKSVMIQSIVKASIDSPDREELLLKLTTERLLLSDVKDLCFKYKLSTMCINPRWTRQQLLMTQYPSLNLHNTRLRTAAPEILNINVTLEHNTIPDLPVHIVQM